MYRPNHDADWETCVSVPDFDWKQIAEPVMKLYTETTDGSAIETKESALVWNYQYADPDFGSCQAKELLDHLESVLTNEPVSVKSGQHIVEVKPQVSATVTSQSSLIRLFLIPILYLLFQIIKKEICCMHICLRHLKSLRPHNAHLIVMVYITMYFHVGYTHLVVTFWFSLY